MRTLRMRTEYYTCTVHFFSLRPGAEENGSDDENSAETYAENLIDRSFQHRTCTAFTKNYEWRAIKYARDAHNIQKRFT